MKKLLMMAVVACMATFAQALTINWNAGLGALDAEAFGSTTGIMLVYSSTETDVANIAAAVDAGTLTSIATIKSATIIMDANANPDYFNAEAIAESKYTTGTYFFVLSNDKDLYISTLDAREAHWFGVPGNPQASLGSDFTKVTVPEPTALALLALGVAGVALRRRRRA